MKTAPHKASGARCSTSSIVGCVEGYLALAFIALLFLAPIVDHPSNAEIIGWAVYFGIAFGLALAGARFGKGGLRLWSRSAPSHSCSWPSWPEASRVGMR